ncbi:hypothetical protein ACFL1E_04345 [Candidatus Omnitrophota bacterium]
MFDFDDLEDIIDKKKLTVTAVAVIVISLFVYFRFVRVRNSFREDFIPNVVNGFKAQQLNQQTDLKVDLDRDGTEEIIKIRGLEVEVFDTEKNRLGRFDISDYSEQLEFIDLSKNGKKQIVVRSGGKSSGFSETLVIYGLKNNKLVILFKLEAGGGIITNFSSFIPSIKSGSNVWVWNGSDFLPGK